MLKQRLITAAVLIPLVVLAILKLPTNVLQWCIAGVTLLAAWEWFAIVVPCYLGEFANVASCCDAE